VRPIVPMPEYCAFVLGMTLPDLAVVTCWNARIAETSATVVLQVESFAAGSAFRLAGPAYANR